MTVTIKFASGEEKKYDGETVANQGGFMVVYKRSLKTRKLQSAETFPVGHVAWARTSDGSIVVGGGRVQSD